MISIIADTHTHTLACDHAYSTITENVKAAARAGLKFLVMTEHTSSLPGAPTNIHFTNLSAIPRQLEGVTLLRGAEVNILDFDGRLDLPESILGRLEWVIASFHTPCITPGTELQHTKCWIDIAHNPLVDVIGHCGDMRYKFDHKTMLRECKSGGKIVEINSHSFAVRPGSHENCRDIALQCAEFDIPIVVSSDAHFHTQIGDFDNAVNMLEEIGFPQKLILNVDTERFLDVVQKTSGKLLTDEK